MKDLLRQLSGAGIDIITKADDPRVSLLELAIADARRVASDITAWENRWGTRNLVDQYPDGVSERAQAILRKAEGMVWPIPGAAGATRDRPSRPCCAGGRRTTSLRWRVLVRTALGGDQPGQPLAPRPTGDAVFNYGTSMLLAPSVTIPLLSVSQLPVGIQIVGQREQNAWVHLWLAGY